MGIVDSEAEFRRLFSAAYTDVVRYVARRTTADPEDIAAEAFAIAWRRWHDMPREFDQARAYVFGIARRLLLGDQSRSARRRSLEVRLADEPRDPSVVGPEDEVVTLLDLRDAWSRLEANHQEVLALHILDGLPSAAAGTVLGISAVAYRIRLSRARAALSELLGPEPTTVTISLAAEGCRS